MGADMAGVCLFSRMGISIRASSITTNCMDAACIGFRATKQSLCSILANSLTIVCRGLGGCCSGMVQFMTDPLLMGL